jgi:RNA polymerase sigma-70 factor, ECF subfamily
MSSILVHNRFTEVYEQHYGEVLRFIARRLIPPDKLRAQDIAHEVFVVAWRRMSVLPVDNQEAKTWLFAVARNCLRNDNRLAHRNNEGVGISTEAIGYLPTNEDIPGLAGLKIDIATAWAKLNPNYQEVMALDIWDNLTADQGAKVLGISNVAYRLRLSRARNQLRKALGGEN